jgi:hypothetical protein
LKEALTVNFCSGRKSSMTCIKNGYGYDGGLLVASRGQFSGITLVYHAAEEKSNGSSVESCPEHLGSMSVSLAVLSS